MGSEGLPSENTCWPPRAGWRGTSYSGSVFVGAGIVVTGDFLRGTDLPTLFGKKDSGLQTSLQKASEPSWRESTRLCGVVSCDSGRARPWSWLTGASPCSLCFQTAPWRHISSSQQAQGTRHGHCSYRRRRCPLPKDTLLVSRELECVAMVTSPPSQHSQIVPSPVQRGW